MTARTVFSVGQVNRYVKKALESDPLLAGLFIAGEISNFNAHSSGHFYFTMKDENAAVDAVMFKNSAQGLKFQPKNGEKIIAFGRLSLYEKTGKYQFYAEYMEIEGIGAARQAFDELKQKLEAEGLFAQERKRQIPKYAKTIAIITSPTGAAVQDILKTIRERNPAAKIILRPAAVQGENAAAELTLAVAEVNARAPHADVIIIGRGGGSAEDLAAFNDEGLVRAIGDSKIPVISAVGHETDFSLCDFAADIRAATPTAAAQIAAFDARQMLEYIRELQTGISDALAQKARDVSLRAEALSSRLTRAINTRLANEARRLSHAESLLEKVSPYAIFARGYALTQTADTTITSIKDITIGQKIKITYADGTAAAVVEDKTYA